MNIAFSMNGVDPNSPLLYRIIIKSSLYYIGCANTARRPQKAYARNVKHMIEGQPYRKSKAEGFRFIHRRMLEAIQNGDDVVIELIRNVPRENKFEEERAEIAKYRQKYGDSVLNRTTIRINKEGEQVGAGDAEEAV